MSDDISNSNSTASQEDPKVWKLPLLICPCSNGEETPDFIINHVCLHPACEKKLLYCGECVDNNLHAQLHESHIFKLKEFLQSYTEALDDVKSEGNSSGQVNPDLINLNKDKEKLLAAYRKSIEAEILNIEETMTKVMDEIMKIFSKRKEILVSYLNMVDELNIFSCKVFDVKLSKYEDSMNDLAKGNLFPGQNELIKQFSTIKSVFEMKEQFQLVGKLKSKLDSVEESNYSDILLLSTQIQQNLENRCPTLKAFAQNDILEELGIKQALLKCQNKFTLEEEDGKNHLHLLTANITEHLDEFCYPDLSQGYKKMASKVSEIMAEMSEEVQDFAVREPNYFSQEVQEPFLHYFYPNSKSLFLLKLPHEFSLQDDRRWIFENIQVNIDFNLPLNHASIATKDGKLFLNGGKDKLDKMYEYNFEEKRLIPRKSMRQKRWDHAICECRGFIYVFGGADWNIDYKLTRRCEKYDLRLDLWTEISGFSREASDFSVCNFQDKFIYKFGGWNMANYVNVIERYDVNFDNWVIINTGRVVVRLGGFPECIQINEKQIFVFGGLSQGNSHRENFLLEIEDLEEEKVKCKNQRPLPLGGVFRGQKSALIHNKAVFTIMKSSSMSSLWCFDGTKWMILKEKILNGNNELIRENCDDQLPFS